MLKYSNRTDTDSRLLVGSSRPGILNVLRRRERELRRILDDTLNQRHQRRDLSLIEVGAEGELCELEVKTGSECREPRLIVEFAEVNRWRCVRELVEVLDVRLTLSLGMILGLKVVDLVRWR